MLLADMGGKPYGKSLNFLQFSVLPTDPPFEQADSELVVISAPVFQEMLLQAKSAGGGGGGIATCNGLAPSLVD